MIPYCIIRSIWAGYDEVLLSLFLAKSFICWSVALITSEHLICNCHALKLIHLEHLIGASSIIASISLYFVHLYAIRSHARRFNLWWYLLKTRFYKPTWCILGHFLRSNFVVSCTCKLVLISHKLANWLLLLRRQQGTTWTVNDFSLKNFLCDRSSVVAACHVAGCCILHVYFLLKQLILISSSCSVLSSCSLMSLWYLYWLYNFSLWRWLILQFWYVSSLKLFHKSLLIIHIFLLKILLLKQLLNLLRVVICDICNRFATLSDEFFKC